MKLTLGGHEYTSTIMDLYRVTIGEARTIKHRTGLTIADWRLGLLTIQREDPDIYAGLIFLLRSRAGEIVNWDDLDAINAQDVTDQLRHKMSEADKAELDQALSAITSTEDETEPVAE